MGGLRPLPMSNLPFAFEVSPMDPLTAASCQVRMFTSPYKLNWRIMPDFFIFMVLSGKLNLLDYTSKTTPEKVMIKKGELYVIPNGIAFESDGVVLPGTKFLNLSVRFKNKHLVKTQSETLAIIQNRFLRNAKSQRSQSTWMIPRRIDLGDQLDAFIQLGTELLHNLRLWNKFDPGSRFIATHLVYLLHSFFTHQTLADVKETQLTPEESHVNQASNYIRIHFDRNISVNDVAESVHLNPAYLSRCFRKITGRTVMDFILKTKIEAAKSFLLERPVPSVKEVGFRSGFGSTAYFCRMFRRYVNRSPQEFAKGMQGKNKRKSLPQ
jgi:AraC-like DNA-binding protein